MDGDGSRWPDDTPHPSTSTKTFGDADRFTALMETEGDDRWIAVTRWQGSSDYWCRITMTDLRVLRLEFEIGPMPDAGGFLPRTAAAGLTRGLRFSRENTTDTLPLTLAGDLTEIVDWTRNGVRRLLGSPLGADNPEIPFEGDASKLTLGEVAYLYDALVRLGSERPTDALSRSLGLSLAAARNKVYRARQQGLLSPTRRGEPGGRLSLEGLFEAMRGPQFTDLEKLVKNLSGEVT